MCKCAYFICETSIESNHNKYSPKGFVFVVALVSSNLFRKESHISESVLSGTVGITTSVDCAAGSSLYLTHESNTLLAPLLLFVLNNLSNPSCVTKVVLPNSALVPFSFLASLCAFVSSFVAFFSFNFIFFCSRLTRSASSSVFFFAFS